MEQRRITAIIAVLVILCGVCNCFIDGIGDRLLRTYFVWKTLPITMKDAESSGWLNYSTCDDDRGIAFALNGAPDSDNPVSLYYTSAGQLAGVSLTVFDKTVPQALLDYWEPTGNGNNTLTVSFRNQTVMCTGLMETAPIGYQAVINQGGVNIEIPLNDTTAEEENWTNGSCIEYMGRHWAYDLQSAPKFTWQYTNLLPIEPMYMFGRLVAFLFSYGDFEAIEPIGDWEGPFIPSLFCENFCQSDCTFNVNFFSTMHFFITDYTLNKCTAHC